MERRRWGLGVLFCVCAIIPQIQANARRCTQMGLPPAPPSTVTTQGRAWRAVLLLRPARPHQRASAFHSFFSANRTLPRVLPLPERATPHAQRSNPLVTPLRSAHIRRPAEPNVARFGRSRRRPRPPQPSAQARPHAPEHDGPAPIEPAIAATPDARQNPMHQNTTPPPRSSRPPPPCQMRGKTPCTRTRRPRSDRAHHSRHAGCAAEPHAPEHDAPAPIEPTTAVTPDARQNPMHQNTPPPPRSSPPPPPRQMRGRTPCTRTRRARPDRARHRHPARCAAEPHAPEHAAPASIEPTAASHTPDAWQDPYAPTARPPKPPAPLPRQSRPPQ